MIWARWFVLAGLMLVASNALALAPSGHNVMLAPKAVCGKQNPRILSPWFPVCQGNLLTVTWGYTLTGYDYVDSPGVMRFQRVVDEVPVGVPFEVQPAATFDVTYDVSQVPDGARMVGLRLLDVPAGSNTYSVYPAPYVLDNVPGPRTDAHEMMVCPRDGGVRPASAPWTAKCVKAQYPGHEPVHQEFAAPTRPQPEPFSALLPLSQIYVENILPYGGVYQPGHRFWRTRDGHIVASDFEAHLNDTYDISGQYLDTRPMSDGPRGAAWMSNFTTYAIHPVTHDIYFVESAKEHGRFGVVTRDGHITTYAGARLKPNTVPYQPLYKTANIPEQQGTPWHEQFEVVGNFTEGPASLALPSDVVIDEQRPGYFFVVDAQHHCIREVNINTAPATITTFAGQCDVEGFQDGPRLGGALFHEPFSMVRLSDGRFAVADRDNDAVRVIDNAGNVTTLFGQGYRPPVGIPGNCTTVKGYSHDGSFAVASTVRPMVVRRDSQDNLIIGEDMTGHIRKVNLATGMVTTPWSWGACINNWVWLAVDYEGTFGPVDHVFWGVTTGGLTPTDNGIATQVNETLYRFNADFSRKEAVFGGYGSHAGFAETDAYNHASVHYPWGIDVRGGLLCANGWSNHGFACARKKLASDPQDAVYNSMAHFGYHVVNAGGIPSSYSNGGQAVQDTPAPRTLHGTFGHSMMGQPSFSQLCDLSDSELEAYIRGGFGTGFPMPQIGGFWLRAASAYVCRLSDQVRQRQLPTPADSVAPTMSAATTTQSGFDLNVAFTTNEEAVVQILIDVVTSGRVAPFRQDQVSDTFATSHAVRVDGLKPDKDYYAWARITDRNGNTRTVSLGTLRLQPPMCQCPCQQ